MANVHTVLVVMYIKTNANWLRAKELHYTVKIIDMFTAFIKVVDVVER